MNIALALNIMTIKQSEAFKACIDRLNEKSPHSFHRGLTPASQQLIATPTTETEEVGDKANDPTWHTIRAAKKRGIRLDIIYPSGSTMRIR